MRDRFERWGWLLFLVCALAFVAAGVRDGDLLLTAGSVAFLVACVLSCSHRRAADAFSRARPRRWSGR
ncbi:MAG TPA: hypothetical protein VFZ70_05830 [Euzebyales bacterium]